MKSKYKVQSTEDFVKATSAIARVIKDVKEIPSGVLYSIVNGMIDIDISIYESMIDTMKVAGLIKISNHYIKWIGKEED